MSVLRLLLGPFPAMLQPTAPAAAPSPSCVLHLGTALPYLPTRSLVLEVQDRSMIQRRIRQGLFTRTAAKRVLLEPTMTRLVTMNARSAHLGMLALEAQIRLRREARNLISDSLALQDAFAQLEPLLRNYVLSEHSTDSLGAQIQQTVVFAQRICFRIFLAQPGAGYVLEAPSLSPVLPSAPALDSTGHTNSLTVFARASQDTSITTPLLIAFQSTMALKTASPLSTVSAGRDLRALPQARARLLQTLTALSSARLYHPTKTELS